MMRHFLFYSILFFSCVKLLAQSYPQNYFRSPLDIPLYLSGNFGELRSNHFHAGLDIKTEGVEGKKVLAIADGYVSRIKVSPYGYGKAIYVTHPNGYTSVYGHLKKYSDKIEALVKKEQYQKERFALQIFPQPFSLQVKKGELIAYSGNSGGSAGPHLHFEIRDSKTEHPINPLFFGYEIEDRLAPDLYAFTIYPLNDSSSINGSKNPKRFTVYGKNGQYYRSTTSPILLHGQFGFGIETVDRMNGTGNRHGIYNLKLFVDEELMFEKQMDEFAFHEGRYINAYIDYANYIRKRRRVQRNYVLAGNKLRCYPTLKNKGTLIFNDQKEHQIRYEVSDFEGNTSTLSFKVKAEEVPSGQQSAQLKTPTVKFFNHQQKNTFINDELLVSLPKGLLYEDLYFEYRKEAAKKNTVSPIYWLHNHYTPLHSYMNISIKVPNLSEAEKQKALIASTTDGRSLYPEGGTWQGDNISVKSRNFGGYTVVLDTVPPSIRPINIYPGANMKNKWSISVKINDRLSGVDSYRAEVDGKWILMEYDAKNDLLVHYFDGRIEAGEHLFNLSVKDGVGNLKTYEAKFYR